jgi:hypothetical protein
MVHYYNIMIYKILGNYQDQLGCTLKLFHIINSLYYHSTFPIPVQYPVNTQRYQSVKFLGNNFPFGQIQPSTHSSFNNQILTIVFNTLLDNITKMIGKNNEFDGSKIVTSASLLHNSLLYRDLSFYSHSKIIA